ncbi:hypothetical protein [Halpernia frigidisoli]|uniref:Uncharacterized protein n=1 Tax=Halpernia frigidisoli TaxID=1125876 RepID=A0A1I3IK33_9FLAO|nr:hypothetical protein [Halpernia frigidisoli]SFI48229.1 hypothetical protein SAMN05443292_2653 [Halpernia frigidisoli]
MMEGKIFIDVYEIGNVDFKIIDENMGVIGGDFLSIHNYDKFKSKVQNFTEKNGNANSADFNFEILIKNIELNPIGGITLLDSKEFDEMYLDAAGLDLRELEKITD